ncbi:MAG: CCA tRNA nucleotidyltransferase [Bullifex sp.]
MKRYVFTKDIISLGKRFSEAGHKLYIVGGAVRDYLLGRENHDYDFTTDATPEEVMAMFPSSTIPTGIKHGTVTVLYRKEAYEITTFRTEGSYSDGRHPDSVSFVRDLEEDLSRRDFTVNAFAASTENGTIIDLHGGLDDLKNGTIRAIGNPKDRFDEDALRMLRAVRFASKLGFEIEENTFEAIKRDAERITLISKERIREEFFRLIDSPEPARGLELLRTSGLLSYILPELEDTFGFEQLGMHTDDVYHHTLKALEVAEHLGYSLAVKLAVLFHDLGKTEARRGDMEDGYTFYGHENISEKIAEKTLKTLKCSTEEIRKTCCLVKNHMFAYTPEWSDSAVRRFIIRVGLKDIPELFDVRRSDALSMDPKADFTLLNSFEERIRNEAEKQSAMTLRDLAVNGNDLKNEKIAEGRKLGQVLNYLLDEVIEDPSLNEREKLINLARIQASRLE